MAKQIEPCKCACGCNARVKRLTDSPRLYFVRCNRIDRLPCWKGPYRKTRTGAVNVWTRMMKKARGK